MPCLRRVASARNGASQGEAAKPAVVVAVIMRDEDSAVAGWRSHQRVGAVCRQVGAEFRVNNLVLFVDTALGIVVVAASEEGNSE